MNIEYRVAERQDEEDRTEFTIESRSTWDGVVGYWNLVKNKKFYSLEDAKVAIFDMKEEAKRRDEVQYHYY
jgi:hypothetical protein